ncbi:MAG: glycosyltransferase family 39 protein [Candidatus Magasanikbacteria bacterium]|nr:glycosyltransferase family 39 protein [Candidatus Magasanikbacteria bacterium]
MFTKQVSEYGLLLYPLDSLKYGELVEFIHPRSAFVEEGVGSSILPVGFWGLPLVYGMIGKIIGVFGTLLITPLLAICAIWGFYGILKKVFDEQIAFFSALLLFFQPVLWYYTTRSLFPNVPFISLILIGAWFLICKPMSRALLNDVVGMSIFMLGILMRPNEIMWVALCFAIVAVWYRAEISLKRLLGWIGVGLFFVVVYAFINHSLYGSSAGSYVSSRSVELQTWYAYIFPFGIHPRTIIKSLWFFMSKLTWWYVMPAKIGLLFFLYDWYRKKLSRAQKVSGAVFVVMSMFLVTYYGSQIDNLYNLKTIGVAYTRYWLPISIGMIPFIVYGFFRIAELFDRNSPLAPLLPKRGETHGSVSPFSSVREGRGMSCFIVYGFGLVYLVVMFILSVNLVFGGMDGITATHKNLLHTAEVKNWVLAHTDDDAILVTDYEDKFFWPDRQVMVRFFDPRVGSAIAELLEKKQIDVYYFGIKLEGESEEKVKEYIEQFRLEIESVQNFDEHGLYRFITK